VVPSIHSTRPLEVPAPSSAPSAADPLLPSWPAPAHISVERQERANSSMLAGRASGKLRLTPLDVRPARKGASSPTPSPASYEYSSPLGKPVDGGNLNLPGMTSWSASRSPKRKAKAATVYMVRQRPESTKPTSSTQEVDIAS
jgi:hypothetical protein